MTTTHSFTVQGMTCQHCVASVTEELQEIPSVEKVEVSLATGVVLVTGPTSVDPTAVRAAVETAGYEVVSP